MDLTKLKSDLSLYRSTPEEAPKTNKPLNRASGTSATITPITDKYLSKLSDHAKPSPADSLIKRIDSSPLSKIIKGGASITQNSVSKLSPRQIGKTEKGKIPLEKIVSSLSPQEDSSIKIPNKSVIERVKNVEIQKSHKTKEKVSNISPNLVDNKNTIHSSSKIDVLKPTKTKEKVAAKLRVMPTAEDLSLKQSDFNVINKKIRLTSDKKSAQLGKKIQGPDLTSNTTVHPFKNSGSDKLSSNIKVEKSRLRVIDSKLESIVPIRKDGFKVSIESISSKFQPKTIKNTNTKSVMFGLSKYGFAIPTAVDFFRNEFAAGFTLRQTKTSFTDKASLFSWSGTKEKAPSVDYFDNRYAKGFTVNQKPYVTNYVPNASAFSFVSPASVNYFDVPRVHTIGPFILFTKQGQTNLKPASSGFVWNGNSVKAPTVDYFDVVKKYTTAGFVSFVKQYQSFLIADASQFVWKGGGDAAPQSDYFDIQRRFQTEGFHRFAKIYDTKFIPDASDFDWDGKTPPMVDFFDVSKRYVTQGFHTFAKIYDTKYKNGSSEFVWDGKSVDAPEVDFFDVQKRFQTVGFQKFAKIYDTKFIPDASEFDFDGKSVNAPTVNFFDVQKRFQTIGFHKFAQIYDTKYIPDASDFDWDGKSANAPSVNYFDVQMRFQTVGFHTFAQLYDTKYIKDASEFDFDGRSVDAPEVDFFDVSKRYQTAGFHKFAKIYDTKYIPDASEFDWDGTRANAPEYDFFDVSKRYQTKGFHKFAQIYDTKYIPDASIFDWDGPRSNAPEYDFFDVSKRYQTKGFHKFAQIYDTKYIPDASIFDWDGTRANAPEYDFFDVAKRYQTKGFHKFAQIYDTKYIKDASEFDWDGNRANAPEYDFFDVSKRYQTKGFHKFAQIYDTKFIPNASEFDFDGRSVDAPEVDFFDVSKRYQTKGFHKFAKIYDTKFINNASQFDWDGSRQSAPSVDYFTNQFAKGFTTFAQLQKTLYVPDSSGFVWKGFPQEVNFFEDSHADGFTVNAQPYVSHLKVDSTRFSFGGSTPTPVDFFKDPEISGFTLNQQLTNLDRKKSRFVFTGKYPVPVDFFPNDNARGFIINQRTSQYKKNSVFGWEGTSQQSPQVNFINDSAASGFVRFMSESQYKGLYGSPIISRFLYPDLEGVGRRLVTNILANYNLGTETLITRDWSHYKAGNPFEISNSLIGKYIQTTKFDFRVNTSPIMHFYYDSFKIATPLIQDIYSSYRRMPELGNGLDRIQDWMRRGKESSMQWDIDQNSNIGPDKILQYFYHGIQNPDYKGILKKYAEGLNPGLRSSFQFDILRWDIAKGTMDVATMNAETIRRYNETLRRLDQDDNAYREIKNPFNTDYSAEQFQKMVDIAKQDTTYDNKLWQSAQVLGTPLLSEQSRGFKVYADVQKAYNKKLTSELSGYRDRNFVLGVLGVKPIGKPGNRLIDLTAEMIPNPTTLIPFNVFGLSSAKIQNLTAGGLIKQLGNQFGGDIFSTAKTVYGGAKGVFGKELSAFESNFGLNSKVGSLIPSQYDVGRLINRISKGGYEFHRFVRSTPDDSARWINYSVDKQYGSSDSTLANVNQDQGEPTRNQSWDLGLVRGMFEESPDLNNLKSIYVALVSSASTKPDPTDPFSAIKSNVSAGTSDSKFKRAQHTIYNPFFDKADSSSTSGPQSKNKIYLDDLRNKGLMRYEFIDLNKQYASRAKRGRVTISDTSKSTAEGSLRTYISEPTTPQKSPMRRLYEAFLLTATSGSSGTKFGNDKTDLALDVDNRSTPELNLNPFMNELHDGLDDSIGQTAYDKLKQYRTMAYTDIPSNINDIKIEGKYANKSNDGKEFTNRLIHHKESGSIPIIDFRDLIKDPEKLKFSTDPRMASYATQNLETKFGLGRHGKPNVNRSLPSTSNIVYESTSILAPNVPKADKGENPLDVTSKPKLKTGAEFRGDRINIIDFKRIDASINKKFVYEKKDFKSDTSFNMGGNGEYNGLPGTDDLIDFYFTSLILKGHGYCPAEVVVFRAILDDITDTPSPSWNAQKYIGRADPVYVYGGYERNLSFGFKIYITSRDELKATYRKINMLHSWNAPEYTRAGTIRGPLIRLNIGHLYRKLPGFFSSFSVKFSNTEATWETAQNAGDLLRGTAFENGLSYPGVLQLPKLIDVSVGFTVIGNYRPQKNGIMYNLYDDDKYDGVETGLMPIESNKVNYFRMFDSGSMDWNKAFPAGYEYARQGGQSLVASVKAGQGGGIQVGNGSPVNPTNNSSKTPPGNPPPDATIPATQGETVETGLESPINTPSSQLNNVKRADNGSVFN